MNIFKIFLASSSELKEEREQFEIMIGRKNKECVAKNMFFELIIWEDFLDAMSKTRLQDEYNAAVKEADLFVMLFYTKVGRYTEEEFDTAFKQFKATGKPLVYTYFKEAPITTGSLDKNIFSLVMFKEKLSGLGHYCTLYKNTEDLKYQFSKQLDKFLTDKTDAPIPSSAGIIQIHIGNGDNVGGNKIVGGKYEP